MLLLYSQLPCAPAPQSLFPPPHPFPSGRLQLSVTWCLLAGADGGSVVLCCSVSAPALGGFWSLCLGSWVFSNRDLRVWIQLLPWEFRLSSLPFLQRQCVFACALGVKVLLACPQWLNALFGEKRYGCDLMLFPQLLSHPSSSFEHGGRFSLDFLLVPLFMRVWWLHVRQAGTWGPLLQCGNAWAWTHLSSKQQNTKKLYGTENNCKVVRAVSEQKIQRYNCQVWRTRSKNRVLRTT